MDRNEAANKFLTIAHPDSLKIVKMTYNHGPLLLEELEQRLGLPREEAKRYADIAASEGLVKFVGGKYECQKAVVDELMAFIKTPCGHCHH